ncbi:hypothetical protein [Mycobacterium attenuatum]|uniref:hypothetical protein n=1 Tax=Mycobacterium attenuatum TaxID=2341086 RepID=UPI000F03E473|nr:hypothetical protein [Mycobacterium attenuatum]VBA61491.1 hypothetical protein LAUMK41_04867 [Mycobacterium attenuatum]
MSSAPGPEAYSLAQAAQLLGVSPQRVGQMVKAGALSGPQYQLKRVPKNAPRVWKWAVDRELALRQPRSPFDSPGQNDTKTANDYQDLGQWLEHKEARINAAAQELKVAADLARQQAAEDRRKARDLMSKLAKVVIQQAEVIDQLKSDLALDFDRSEQMLDAYSNALTQLLTPDDLGHL